MMMREIQDTDLRDDMGSTGSGSFSDYSGSRPKEGDNGAGGGGASGDDRCERAIACTLEEVERSEYFTAKGDVPSAGIAISIEQRGRLFAVAPNGQTIGALPTRFNYLAECMTAGFSYAGFVTASATNPVATVSVDMAPRQT